LAGIDFPQILIEALSTIISRNGVSAGRGLLGVVGNMAQALNLSVLVG